MKQLLEGRRFRLWLALSVSSFIVLAAAYTMAQQSTRLSVNDLPLQTAQTIKHELESGANPADVVPTIKTDLRSDSTVFASITDQSKNILASSAELDGQPSLPPAGTFDYTTKHGTDHFTWQPEGGVRLATRILPYKYGAASGYIVTGQSLHQAESRINIYGWIMLLAWLAVLVFCFAVLWLPFN